jgi:hypothetical protein
MQAALRVRRARRADFARVQALLGASGEPSRADRKRFRRLVGTMREDLYLAERDDDQALAGLAVIAYVRGLGPATAIVRTLRGTSAARELLLESARRHAVARGCTQLEVQDDPSSGADEATAFAAPWCEGPRILRRAVSA